MADKNNILLCLHCGNKAPFEIKNVTTSFMKISFTNGDEEDVEYYYTTIQCVSCQEVMLLGEAELSDSLSDLNTHTVLFPAQKYLSATVPSEIRATYEEAQRVKKISPTAFAVMIRRALEYMCLDQKATGKSLHTQLEDLAKRKIIPDTLAEMSDSLRLLGNLGAHASDIKIGREDTAIIDDFFMALLEYVYIAPEKVKSFKEKMTQRTQKINS